MRTVTVTGDMYDDPRFFNLGPVRRERVIRMLLLADSSGCIRVRKCHLLRKFNMQEQHWDAFIEALQLDEILQMVDGNRLQFADWLVMAEDMDWDDEDLPGTGEYDQPDTRRVAPSETAAAAAERKRRQRERERRQRERERMEQNGSAVADFLGDDGRDMGMSRGGVTPNVTAEVTPNVTNSLTCAVSETQKAETYKTPETVSETTVPVISGTGEGHKCLEELRAEIDAAAYDTNLAKWRARTEQMATVSSRMVGKPDDKHQHINIWNHAYKVEKLKPGSRMSGRVQLLCAECERIRARHGWAVSARFQFECKALFEAAGEPLDKLKSSFRPEKLSADERGEWMAARAAMEAQFGALDAVAV